MDSVAVTGMHRTQPRLVGDAFLLVGVDRLKAEHAPIEFDRSCRAFDVERRFKDSVQSIWTPMFEQEDAGACAWVYMGGRASQRSELVLAILFRHSRTSARLRLDPASTRLLDSDWGAPCAN